MNRRVKIFALTLFMALVCFVPGPVNAAYVLKKTWASIPVVLTTGEAITRGQIVAIADADGYVYKADADLSTRRPAVGIATESAASGGHVNVATYCYMTGWSSLAEGSPGYISATAGAVTQSAQSYVQCVAKAITSTGYLFDFRDNVDTSTITTVGVLTDASPFICEGATANAYETTVTITDPTADNTITVPDVSGTVMLSSLATNGADAANAVTGASNGLVFEGATADTYETTITPTDATADRTITLPNGSGTVMISSLATNVADAANAVTGTSNGILFEGATADGYETTVTPADATADRTVTIPDALSGYVHVTSVTAHAATGNVTAAECYGGIVTNTGAVGAAVLTLPVAVVGMRLTVWLTVAQDVDINPQDGTTILALTSDAGDAISSAATIGNMVTLVALSTTTWGAVGSSGTWSDSN